MERADDYQFSLLTGPKRGQWTVRLTVEVKSVSFLQ
jgi:hypothetical protein